MSSDLIQNSYASCATILGTPFHNVDPETFKTPWKVVEEEFSGNLMYTLVDNEGTVVAIIGRSDHAEFVCHRVNRFFEGL